MAKKIVSIVLKFIIVLSVAVGATISSWGRVSSLLFFTTQSNIWIAALCIVELVIVFAKKPLASWMFTAKLIFTVSITLTGFVYVVMLAPFIESGAYTLDRTLLHVVVPIAAAVDFFLVDYPTQSNKLHTLLVTVPPSYYLAFAGIGFALNWDFMDGQNYPYYFLNWGSPAGAFRIVHESPYIGVVYYVLILLGIVVGMGYMYVWLSSVIRKRSSKHN